MPVLGTGSTSTTITLLGRNAREAVNNAGVALDLAGADLGVRVLRLDDELDALNGRRHGLRDPAEKIRGHGIARKNHARHLPAVGTHAPLMPPARKLIVKSLTLLIF